MRRALLAIGLVLLATSGAEAATTKIYFADRDSYNTLGYGAISGLEAAQDGSLSVLPGTPYPVGTPYTDSIALTPDGRRGFGTSSFAGAGFVPTVQGFAINTAGVLTPAQAGFDPPSENGSDTAVSPDGRFGFVPGTNGVQAYSISAGGALTTIAGSPFGPASVFRVQLTPDGKYLFAITAGGNLIQRYAVQADGTLAHLGGTPTGAANPSTLTITPDGRALYAGSSGDSTVTTLAVDANGGLTPVGAPLAVGAGFVPQGVVVAPNGRTLYIADINLNAVRVFSLAADGTPTQGASGAAIDDAQKLVVTPDGRFLYVSDDGGPVTVKGFALNPDGSIGGQVGTGTVFGGDDVQPVAQPAQPPTAAFKSTPAVPGATTKFDARGSTDSDGKIVRYDWDFGDGSSLANGGAVPIHAYTEPGVYDVKLTVTDDQNCSTQFVWAGFVAYCNGGPSATMTAKLDTLPVLSALSISNRRFAVAAAKKKRVKRGTAFRYRLSEAATVKFTIEQKTKGRKSGKKCVKKRKSNARRKKCTRYVGKGSLSAKGVTGKNSTRFSGKLKGKILKRGSYRARAVATDKAGGKSAPKTVSFSVVR